MAGCLAQVFVITDKCKKHKFVFYEYILAKTSLKFWAKCFLILITFKVSSPSKGFVRELSITRAVDL